MSGKKDLFDVANNLEPQRISYEEWRKNPADASTVFARRRNDPSFPLLPVLAGEWQAAPLLNQMQRICGVVYWHEDTVGITAKDAAHMIQRDICIEGNAGMYNINKEPIEYEEHGGRLVGRDMWENYSSMPINEALDEASPEKFGKKLYEKEKVVWGPDFMFTAAESYLTQVWPTLKHLEAYGAKPDDYDPTSPNPRLWHNKHSKHDGNKYKSYVRGLFESQEYLAGRILTTTVKEKHQAAHMLVAFTYSSPENMDDAFVVDAAVSGIASRPLMKKQGDKKSGLIPFAIESNQDALRPALESVSSNKILELLEWEFMRNDKTSTEQLVQALHKVILVLYGGSSAVGEEPKSAPSLISFFLSILSCLKPKLMEACVVKMHSNVLKAMVRAADSHYENKQDPYNPGYPPKPSVLLAKSPSLHCSQILVDAGVIPDIETLADAMDEYEVFIYLANQYLQASTDNRDSVLSKIAFKAAKRLKVKPLEWILGQMSTSGIKVLLFNQTTEIFGPVPLWDKRAPPASHGSLMQVVMGNFAMKYSAYPEYLWSLERCKKQNQSGSGTKCTMSIHVKPDIFEIDLRNTVNIIIHFAIDKAGTSLGRNHFELTSDFWDDLGHIKIGCGLGREKLVEHLTNKHNEMLNWVDQRLAEEGKKLK